MVNKILCRVPLFVNLTDNDSALPAVNLTVCPCDKDAMNHFVVSFIFLISLLLVAKCRERSGRRGIITFEGFCKFFGDISLLYHLSVSFRRTLPETWLHVCLYLPCNGSAAWIKECHTF